MTYAAAVLADSPLVFYRLEESSGTTAADSSGNSHDGTYHGSPTLGVAGALCEGTHGVSFDGVDDYIDVSLNLSGTDKVSVEFWGKIGPNPGYWYDQGSGTNSLWALPDIAATVHRLGETGIAGANTNDGTAVATSGPYHYYVITYDRAQSAAGCINLYVDAVLQTLTNNNSFNNNGNFASATMRIMRGLGHDPYNTLDFNQGTLDEFAVYTSVLSQARIIAHYNAGVFCNQEYWGVLVR